MARRRSRRTGWEEAVEAARASYTNTTPKQTGHGDSGDHMQSAYDSSESTALKVGKDTTDSGDGNTGGGGAETRNKSARMMQVFVRSTYGRTLVFDVDSDASVASLQDQIHGRMGVPVQLQQLTYAGTTLAPGALLGATMQNEASLELTVNGRGGSSEGHLPELSPTPQQRQAPPRPRRGNDESYSSLFVPLIAAAWNQTHGVGMLPWIAESRTKVGGGVWDAAVSCLRRTRVDHHPLHQQDWVDDGMYMAKHTQERLLECDRNIDSSTPEPMRALFTRIVGIGPAAEASGEASAEAGGAAATTPAAPAGAATAPAEHTTAPAPVPPALAPPPGPTAAAATAATTAAAVMGAATTTAAAATAAAPPPAAESPGRAGVGAGADTTGARRHRGRMRLPLQPVHLEHMLAFRGGREATLNPMAGTHKCGWCDKEVPDFTRLRQHMQRPECSTEGSTLGQYLEALGVSKWYACGECGDVCLRRGQYKCGCRLDGRAPPWNEQRNQQRQNAARPVRQHGPQDAQRRRSDRVGHAQAGEQAQRGPDEVAQPLEVVRCFTDDFVAVDEYDDKVAQLWDVVEYFAGDEAQAAPKTDQNVDAEFVLLMEEFNNMAASAPAERQRMPEPNCTKRAALLQAQAAVALQVLPGLARRMQRVRGWRTPSSMKALLAGPLLADEIHQHGRAATVLDYFILPFTRAHPKAQPAGGGANTIEVETLRHLVQEGKLSKAAGLARMKHDAEVRRLPTTARPSKVQIQQTVADKFPQPAAGEEAIPTHADLPPQSWLTGVVDLGSGTEEERAERGRTFGVKSTQLKLDILRKVLGQLSKQKAAGVDAVTNVFLRRVFEDGEAETVETVLQPFAAMCLAGTVHPEAMGFLLASRLALVPKVDDDAPPAPAGVLPPAPVDFRPLGIGGTLMRLISTSVCAQDGSDVGRALASRQLAVRVADGTCIMVAMAQACFTHGRSGGGGAHTTSSRPT